MKKITLLFALLLSTIAFSQKNKIETTEVKVSKMTYEVEDAEELKAIDWDNVKEVFSYNTKNEEIEMSFVVNYKKGKRKLKNSIKVGGKSNNIDSLIILAKKGVQSIIKISNKNKN